MTGEGQLGEITRMNSLGEITLKIGNALVMLNTLKSKWRASPGLW